MTTRLGPFPRIIDQSRRQMKDVELTAQLLLLVEAGQPRGYSQDELDAAFALASARLGALRVEDVRAVRARPIVAATQ